jgi:branched-chain amino acid transport system ATP-binding protein
MALALKTEGLVRDWGALRAVSDVSFSLAAGARHALIGPNGAGKTTFINVLAGVLRPSAGEVFLDGERITHLPQHLRVKRGMTRTFQINTLFPGLTALESVVLAVCERDGSGGDWFRPVAGHRRQIEEARAVLDGLHLGAVANELTRNLPYGKQRLLEIALALATRPRILLLDEPAAGIPIGESTEVFGALARLPQDVTILFIEHDMDLVFRFAERITVMLAGRILVEGTPEEVARNPKVREVYLGEAQHG